MGLQQLKDDLQLRLFAAVLVRKAKGDSRGFDASNIC